MGLIIFWAKEVVGNFAIIREDMLKIMSKQIERWNTYYYNPETKKFTTSLDPALRINSIKFKRQAIEVFNEMIQQEKKQRALTTFKQISQEEYHGYVANDLLIKWSILSLDSQGEPLYSSFDRNVNNQRFPRSYPSMAEMIREVESFEVN